MKTSSGNEQVNGSMAQLDKATQQKASASEELAANLRRIEKPVATITTSCCFFKRDENAQQRRNTGRRMLSLLGQPAQVLHPLLVQRVAMQPQILMHRTLSDSKRGRQ